MKDDNPERLLSKALLYKALICLKPMQNINNTSVHDFVYTNGKLMVNSFNLGQTRKLDLSKTRCSIPCV